MDYSLNSKDFYIALESDHLIGSHCPKCGHYTIPQRQICPKCHAADNQLVVFSGKGTLAAYTVISVPPTQMEEAGYNAKNPYCVGIVELEEGPSISAQILEVDVMHPAEIKIGMPLKMTTVHRGEGEMAKTYLAFNPA